MSKIVGIYRIGIEDGKCYIGSSVDIKRRWTAHRNKLRRGVHHSLPLQNAWNKYGESAFVFEVIEECENDTLILREQFWIDSQKPAFNVAPAAGSPMLGRKHTQEARNRMSAARVGNQYSKGFKHTDETKALMSASRTGQVFTPERCANISAAKKGKKFTPEHVEAMRQSHSRPEVKAKISESRKGNQDWLGRKHTPESRQKMSESQKARYAKATNE